MPRGPKGEKRPADVIGAAIMVARIATGEVEDKLPPRQAKAGKVGGRKRADKLSPDRKREIAKTAASKRWAK